MQMCCLSVCGGGHSEWITPQCCGMFCVLQSVITHASRTVSRPSRICHTCVIRLWWKQPNLEGQWSWTYSQGHWTGGICSTCFSQSLITQAQDGSLYRSHWWLDQSESFLWRLFKLELFCVPARWTPVTSCVVSRVATTWKFPEEEQRKKKPVPTTSIDKRYSVRSSPLYTIIHHQDLFMGHTVIHCNIYWCLYTGQKTELYILLILHFIKVTPPPLLRSQQSRNTKQAEPQSWHSNRILWGWSPVIGVSYNVPQWVIDHVVKI